MKRKKMIKNKMKTIILSAALTATSLLADISDYEFKTKSLVGIEGGFNVVDYVYNSANSPKSSNLASAGLKIGAETRDFRVFLSTRYLFDTGNEYDYIVTYGGEVQYKFNASEVFNFYLGVNGGMANIRFTPPIGTYRTITSPYFGGDMGTNIHLGDTMDLELGARVMSIQETNTIDGIEYRFNNIITGYASLIFKWQMD